MNQIIENIIDSHFIEHLKKIYFSSVLIFFISLLVFKGMIIVLLEELGVSFKK